MRVAGIDWGAKSIKVALLSGFGRRLRVIKFASAELPNVPDEEKYFEASERTLAELFRKYRIPRDRVVVGLSMQEAMLRELVVPFTSDEQIKKVIKFEVENYIPSFSIEDLLVDSYRLETVGDKTRLLAIALEKRKLSQRLAVLHRLGIDPVAVDLDVMAAYNAVAASELVKELASFLVIDFGAGSTKLILVEEGRLAMIRALRMGSETLTSSIQKDLEIDYEEAKTKRLKVDLGETGSPDGGPVVSLSQYEVKKGGEERIITTEELEEELILQREEDFLERICKEISRTLSLLKLQRPIALVCIVGGGSSFKDAELFFTNRLGIETVRLDLLSYYRTSLAKADQEKHYPVAAVAIGCALKEFGRDAGGLNFRKEEFRYANRFELLKSSLTTLVAVILILFLLFNWGISRFRASYERSYAGLVSRAKDYYDEELMGAPLPAGKSGTEVRGIHQALVGRIAELAGPEAQFPQIRSGLVLWYWLWKAISQAKDRAGFKLHTLVIEQQELVLEADLRDEVAMESVKNALQDFTEGEERPFKKVSAALSSGSFAADETGGAKPVRRFTITISLSEEGEG